MVINKELISNNNRYLAWFSHIDLMCSLIWILSAHPPLPWSRIGGCLSKCLCRHWTDLQPIKPVIAEGKRCHVYQGYQMFGTVVFHFFCSWLWASSAPGETERDGGGDGEDRFPGQPQSKKVCSAGFLVFCHPVMHCLPLSTESSLIYLRLVCLQEDQGSEFRSGGDAVAAA